MREDRELPVLAITFDAFKTKTQPVRQCKVDSFVEVHLGTSQMHRKYKRLKTDSMIETSMISLGERDHKLPGTLVAGVNANTSLADSLGVHQCDQLEQEVRLRFEEVRRLIFDSGLKFLSVLPWDPVPGFGFAPMHYN